MEQNVIAFLVGCIVTIATLVAQGKHREKRRNNRYRN